MRHTCRFFSLVALGLLMGAGSGALLAPSPATAQVMSGSVKVHVWPRLPGDVDKRRLEDVILEEINRPGHTEILVQAYVFTHADIATALVDAATKRNVKVRVIVNQDEQEDKFTQAEYLRLQGIPVQSDHKAAIAHSKIMVLDGVEVLTGSPNLSADGLTTNAENLVMIFDPVVADYYKQNFTARSQDHLTQVFQYDYLKQPVPRTK